MSASHREIIRAAIADLGMATTNKQIRAWARQHHNLEIKNNEIINAVGSQRERTDHCRRNNVSGSQRLSRYLIASPSAEFGSTSFSSNWRCSHA